MDKGHGIVWSRRQTSRASGGGTIGGGNHAVVLGGTSTEFGRGGPRNTAASVKV
jgi:hypothetical protein